GESRRRICCGRSRASRRRVHRTVAAPARRFGLHGPRLHRSREAQRAVSSMVAGEHRVAWSWRVLGKSPVSTEPAWPDRSQNARVESATVRGAEFAKRGLGSPARQKPGDYADRSVVAQSMIATARKLACTVVVGSIALALGGCGLSSLTSGLGGGMFGS